MRHLRRTAVLLALILTLPSAVDAAAGALPGSEHFLVRRLAAKKRRRPTLRPPAPVCPPLEAWTRGARSLPFGPGERLEYIARVRGIYAGRMEVETGRWLREGGQPEIAITAHAKTNSFFSKIKRADGTITSHMRGPGLLSRGFERRLELDEAVVNETLRFDQRSGRGEMHYSRAHYKPVVQGFAVHSRSDVDDALSGVWRMRTQPLKVGDAICLDVFGLRRFWRVSGEVKAAEGRWTPAGYFNTLLLEGDAVRFGKGSGPGRYPLKIWLSNDARRLPVRIESELALGALTLELDSYQLPRRRRGTARRRR